MRGDATSRVLTGDAGLLTQRGNDTPIQIAVRKARAPKRKQKVDLFAGLLITRRRLIGAFLLPRANRLADDAVHGLRKGGARLIDRDIEQADALGARLVTALIPDTAHRQTTDFVLAQARKQPHQNDTAHHRERIEVTVVPRRRQIGFGEIQASPDELRPDVIADHAWLEIHLRGERPRLSKRTSRMETPRNPFPLLAIREEARQGIEKMELGPWQEWPPRILESPARDRQCPFTDSLVQNHGDRGGGRRACPSRWRTCRAVRRGGPATDHEQLRCVRTSRFG